MTQELHDNAMKTEFLCKAFRFSTYQIAGRQELYTAAFRSDKYSREQILTGDYPTLSRAVWFDFSCQQNEADKDEAVKTGKFFVDAEIFDKERIETELNGRERNKMLKRMTRVGSDLTHFVKLRDGRFMPFEKNDVVITGKRKDRQVVTHPYAVDKPFYAE